MSDGLLTFADGLVRLGKDTLPGILVNQAISNAVRYDESQNDSMSGKAKVPLGWEDADVTLTLDLLCDEESDCYEKLTVINRIFKGADRRANPKIYDVTGRHLRARGINRVVFSRLESNESDEDDTIQVTIGFVEHLPAVVKRERQANAQAKKTGTAAPQTKAQPKASPAITKDPSPFKAGFDQGSS